MYNKVIGFLSRAKACATSNNFEKAQIQASAAKIPTFETRSYKFC